MATAVATEAPASRKECFGVFCTTYDLKAVSPSASRGPSPLPLPVFAEMLRRFSFFFSLKSRILFPPKASSVVGADCGPWTCGILVWELVYATVLDS